MKIGFVGAGKVGVSLGKYFAQNGVPLGGYYSKSPASAQAAAEFTNSNLYDSLEDMVSDNTVLFLTVPDDAIGSVWNHIKRLPNISNKMVCHCSGALSSGICSDAEELGVSSFSVHPFFAIHSKTESYQLLSDAVFTVEGSANRLGEMVSLLEGLGNHVFVLRTEEKVKYHAAAVMASNHVIALAQLSADLLCDCGFSQDAAIQALSSLMKGNVQTIMEKGTVDALTGPIERNDGTTVQKHLNCLNDAQQALYRLLSKPLVELAKQKHPDRDFSELERRLADETYRNNDSSAEKSAG